MVDVFDRLHKHVLPLISCIDCLLKWMSQPCKGAIDPPHLSRV